MSTLKVTNIESPSGGGVNAKITDINGGQLSNRNLIINGAMLIDQRNAGSSVTVDDANNYFAADRFKFGISSSPTGEGTLQQVSDGPDGFEKSNKFTVTTADSSIPATQSYNLMQEIEGQNVSNLAWGSSAAETVTFSFYVKTSLNGTFGGSIQNSARDRSYPFTYDISSSEANTWVRREITVVGDTSGTWLTTNGVGLRVLWGIGNGSSRTASAGAWAASDARGATGQVQVIGTNSATFQVTGVQLEVGEVATAFEHRSFGDELARCQRYYYMIADGNSKSIVSGAIYATNNFYSVFTFPVVMRAAPTLDSSSGSNYFDLLSDGVSDNFNAVLLGNSSTTAAELRAHSSEGLSGATAGHAAWMRTNNSAAHIALTAEP